MSIETEFCLPARAEDDLLETWWTGEPVPAKSEGRLVSGFSFGNLLVD